MVLCNVKQKLLIVIQEINDDVPMDTSMKLLEGGYIDSFDIVNIVSEVEEYFHVGIPPEEIIPENFISVDRMFDMMQRIMKLTKG